jgi:hypothetical protein
MAKRSPYKNRMTFDLYRLCTALTFVSAICAPACSSARADEECTTVKDCARQMVELANDLKAQNVALTKRVQELEGALNKQARDAAAALEARITQLKNGTEQIPAPLGNSRTATCPPGTTMVAVLFQSDGGGPHGITSFLSPVCRTLN